MIALPIATDGVIAVGWATVDVDRAARELVHLLAPGEAEEVGDGSRTVAAGGEGPGFKPTASSAILGARCRSGAATTSGLWIALLEPETEGRLAAWLARSGEGWAAIWILADALATQPAPRLSAARLGPFGPERLVLGAARGAPHRLVVDAVPSRS